MGMQAGFTKYCCFLCLWDSRAVSQHYKQKDWRSRSTFVPGEHSLKENPLVDMNKVLLPPLHIKLGLMKNFVKVLHKNGAAFCSGRKFSYSGLAHNLIRSIISPNQDDLSYSLRASFTGSRNWASCQTHSL